MGRAAQSLPRCVINYVTEQLTSDVIAEHQLPSCLARSRGVKVARIMKVPRVKTPFRMAERSSPEADTATGLPL